MAAALADEDLAALNVMRCEKRIRSAAGCLYRIAALVDDKGCLRVARTKTTEITDIVAKRRHGEMQPVELVHVFDQSTSLQNRLADDGHHHGMIAVVIEGIAVGDPFDHELGDRT